MQSIAINNVRSSAKNVRTKSISDNINSLVAKAEESRLGVVAALILLQVTIAGFNVVIPPMIGVSSYLMAPGIIMTFLANAIALAQCNMRYVLAFFLLSMTVNAAISIYCFVQLINS